MLPAVPEPSKPVENFYASVIDDAEALAAAHEIEGFDHELAMLRARLRKRMKPGVEDPPVDYQLLLRSVTLIVRAVAARYRMSEKNTRDLAGSMLESLRRLADEVMPPREEDV